MIIIKKALVTDLWPVSMCCVLKQETSLLNCLEFLFSRVYLGTHKLLASCVIIAIFYERGVGE